MFSMSMKLNGLTELVDAQEGERGYGLATLHFNGVAFHIEVVEVHPCTNCFADPQPAHHWCEQTIALSRGRQQMLEEIYQAWGGSGPWCTVEEKGRQFIVLMLPHCT